jgi:hypothetical protein
MVQGNAIQRPILDFRSMMVEAVQHAHIFLIAIKHCRIVQAELSYRIVICNNRQKQNGIR